MKISPPRTSASKLLAAYFRNVNAVQAVAAELKARRAALRATAELLEACDYDSSPILRYEVIDRISDERERIHQLRSTLENLCRERDEFHEQMEEDLLFVEHENAAFDEATLAGPTSFPTASAPAVQGSNGGRSTQAS